MRPIARRLGSAMQDAKVSLDSHHMLLLSGLIDTSLNPVTAKHFAIVPWYRISGQLWLRGSGLEARSAIGKDLQVIWQNT